MVVVVVVVVEGAGNSNNSSFRKLINGLMSEAFALIRHLLKMGDKYFTQSAALLFKISLGTFFSIQFQYLAWVEPGNI